jgi:hypothetical protein
MAQRLQELAARTEAVAREGREAAFGLAHELAAGMEILLRELAARQAETGRDALSVA